MLDLVKTNIATAWCAFTMDRDYASARQVPPLLIPGKGNGVTFPSTCVFLSNIRPIKIGSCARVLPRGAIRNVWERGACVCGGTALSSAARTAM